MKAIYKKLLPDEIWRQLQLVAPDFKPYKVRLTKEQKAASCMTPGEMVFARQLDERNYLFMSFIPHASQETLLLDVGWSNKGRFPFDLPRVSDITTDGAEFLKEEFMTDFGVLYHSVHGVGFWGWEVWKCSVDARHPNFTDIFVREDMAPVSESEAYDLVSKSVSRAMSDVKLILLPYFNRYVESPRRARLDPPVA